jgi:hypothetical protein
LALSLRSALDLLTYQEYAVFGVFFDPELEGLLALCKKGGVSRTCRELAAKIVGIGYSRQDIGKCETVLTEVLKEVC